VLLERRSCSALAGTPADLATDEAAAHRFFDQLERGEKRLRDKRSSAMEPSDAIIRISPGGL
jgi:hypothetical protein